MQSQDTQETLKDQSYPPAARGLALPPAPQLPAGDQTPGAPQPAEHKEMTPEEKRMMWGLIIGGVVLLALIVLSVYGLVRSGNETVAKIRDIFIIFMALISLLTSVALVILMIQLARLINLLQNEIKPILDSTNETVNHLRGTTVFLSDNLVAPVIKLNEYLAGLSQFFSTIGLFRKGSKRPPSQGD
jgi:hypothetical protein